MKTIYSKDNVIVTYDHANGGQYIVDYWWDTEKGKGHSYTYHSTFVSMLTRLAELGLTEGKDLASIVKQYTSKLDEATKEIAKTIER